MDFIILALAFTMPLIFGFGMLLPSLADSANQKH